MKKLKAILTWLVKAAAVLSSLLASAMFFSTLSNIHGKDMLESEFINGNPTIINLLNSELFMGLIFVITLSIFSYVFYLLWQLHEVAVHESEQKKSAHTNVVFALSLCGLFINKVWWVLAIIIAFTRWDVVSKSLSAIIDRGVNGAKRTEENS